MSAPDAVPVPAAPALADAGPPERGPLTRVERACLVLALLLAAALLIPLRHYITDDTFIHLQYGRRLADGQGLVFNAGERVYGCTSPLWAMLLGAAMLVGLDGLFAAHALGLVATLGSVLLFFQLTRRTLATPALRGLATLAWAGHAWNVRWGLSGMETPLAVALTIAAFVTIAGSRPRPVLAGTLIALAALTRPEAVFLLVLWAVLTVAERGADPWPRRVAAVIPGLALYGGWLLFAAGYYGTPWPQTLAAKTAGALGLEYQISNLWRQIRIVGATDGLLVVVLATALLAVRAGSVRRDREGGAAHAKAGAAPGPGSRPLALLPWAWVAGVPVLYAARGVPVLSRYLLPILPVLAWLAWRAAERWWMGEGAAPARRRRAVVFGAALAALVLAQNLVVYSREVVPHVLSFSAGLERSLVYWGRWFGGHAPPGSSIATPDIGAIGYYSGRPVVDLAGLVTPRIVPLLEREPEGDVSKRLSFAGFARPRFLVDRAPAENDLMRRSPYASCLTPLGHASVANLGIARPGEVVYTFYRIEWACYEELHGAP